MARHVLLVVAGVLEVPAADLAVVERAGGGVGAAHLVRHGRAEDVAQVRVGARICNLRRRRRRRSRRRSVKFGRRSVLRLDDVGGIVGRAEVAGVVGGGHAAGLPLVLPQVLLEVAGVGVGGAAELAGVDGGRGICNIC